MNAFLRALFLVAPLTLSGAYGSAIAETVEVNEPAAAKKEVDAKKPDAAKAEDAKKPEDTKKAEDSKKPADGKKPADVAKATDGKKAAETYRSSEVYQSSASFLGSKFAVGGYDTVAYHTGNKPVPGTDEFTHMWKGATWRFSSKENLELFVKEPEKYAPQYGGYCAFAVAHKGLSPGDPRHWRIVDGKLYLNVDASVQTKWNKEHVAFIKRGDSNWPNVLK